VIQFADYVIARLPFQVQTIQTDTGAEFQSALHLHIQARADGWQGQSGLTWPDTEEVRSLVPFRLQ